MFQVYLAGPITGLTYEGCTDWRDYAKGELDRKSKGKIVALSPMRWKGDLRGRGNVILDTYEDTVLSSQRGITARDRFDTTRSQAVLFNLLGAQRVSIGTMFEVAWADAYRIPSVLVMEKPEFQNIHEHAMLREMCPFRTDTLDHGIDLITKILMD